MASPLYNNAYLAKRDRPRPDIVTDIQSPPSPTAPFDAGATPGDPGFDWNQYAQWKQGQSDPVEEARTYLQNTPDISAEEANQPPARSFLRNATEGLSSLGRAAQIGSLPAAFSPLAPAALPMAIGGTVAQLPDMWRRGLMPEEGEQPVGMGEGAFEAAGLVGGGVGRAAKGGLSALRRAVGFGGKEAPVVAPQAARATGTAWPSAARTSSTPTKMRQSARPKAPKSDAETEAVTPGIDKVRMNASKLKPNQFEELNRFMGQGNSPEDLASLRRAVGEPSRSTLPEMTGFEGQANQRIGEFAPSSQTIRAPYLEGDYVPGSVEMGRRLGDPQDLLQRLAELDPTTFKHLPNSLRR